MSLEEHEAVFLYGLLKVKQNKVLIEGDYPGKLSGPTL
jgi:hypothetical protein